MILDDAVQSERKTSGGDWSMYQDLLLGLLPSITIEWCVAEEALPKRRSAL
jgi:hypothetical protein